MEYSNKSRFDAAGMNPEGQLPKSALVGTPEQGGIPRGEGAPVSPSTEGFMSEDALRLDPDTTESASRAPPDIRVTEWLDTVQPSSVRPLSESRILPEHWLPADPKQPLDINGEPPVSQTKLDGASADTAESTVHIETELRGGTDASGVVVEDAPQEA